MRNGQFGRAQRHLTLQQQIKIESARGIAVRALAPVTTFYALDGSKHRMRRHRGFKARNGVGVAGAVRIHGVAEKQRGAAVAVCAGQLLQVGEGGGKFSVLGTTGFNTTFPSIKLDTRVGVNWANNGWAADVFWNRTGSYNNWGGNTVAPITRNAAGLPTGGGDKVEAGNFFDAHAAYDFQGEGFVKGLQLFVDVNNIFDKTPPFYNSNNGYDSYSGNPLGRLTTVGFRKKF